MMRMAAPRPTYHHGDLRARLVEVASELVARDGADGFRLREAARILGVDIASIYRHYRNRQDLLAAVAEDAVERFTAELERASASEDSGVAQLRALTRSYVRFAEANPALFRLIFSPLGVGLQSADMDELPGPGRVFREVIERCVRDEVSDLTFEEVGLLPWTGVHGLACLVTDGLLDMAILERLATEVSNGLLRSFRRPPA